MVDKGEEGPVGLVTRPRALLVAGPPGSGKSTVGALLAQRLGAALIDLDTATADLTSVIARLLGTDDLDDPRLATTTRAARYEAIAALAVDNLRVGVGVVLVAPFTAERRDRDVWAALSARLEAAGGVPVLVWLQIDAVTVAGRLARRGAARDAAKVAGVSDQAGPELGPPVGPHLRADATMSPGRLADAIIARLPSVS